MYVMQYVGYLSFSLHQDCANSLHATLEPTNQFMLVLGVLSAHSCEWVHTMLMNCIKVARQILVIHKNFMT